MQRRILVITDGARDNLRWAEDLARALSGLAPPRLTAPLTGIRYLLMSVFARFARRVTLAPFVHVAALRFLAGAPRALFRSQRPDIIIAEGVRSAPVLYCVGRALRAPTVLCGSPGPLAPTDFGMVVALCAGRHSAFGRNVIHVLRWGGAVADAHCFAEAVSLAPTLPEDIRSPLALVMGDIDPDQTEEIVSEALLASEEYKLHLVCTVSPQASRSARVTAQSVCGIAEARVLCACPPRGLGLSIPAIIGLCDIIVTTEDCIDLIFQAVAGGRHVILVDAMTARRGPRNYLPLRSLLEKELIMVATPSDLNECIERATEMIRDGLWSLPEECSRVALALQRHFFRGGFEKEVPRL